MNEKMNDKPSKLIEELVGAIVGNAPEGEIPSVINGIRDIVIHRMEDSIKQQMAQIEEIKLSIGATEKLLSQLK